MTVKQLIEYLKKMPQDAEVRVMEESDCLEHPIIHVEQESGDVRIEYRYTDD